MTDTSHLQALINRLSHERARLEAATDVNEIEMRAVWVRQREKEVNGEECFLGLPETDYSVEISIDDIFAELEL